MIENGNPGSAVQQAQGLFVVMIAMLMAIPIVYFAFRWLQRKDESSKPPANPVDAAMLSGDAAGELMIAKAKHDKPALLDKTPPDAADPFALPRRIVGLMCNYPGQWAVAGGWAVDLHLQRLTRAHSDIEVAILRRDQHKLAEYLIGWRPHVIDKAGDGSASRWRPGEVIDPPSHEIHTTPPQADISALEFLLNESDGDHWIYRRNQAVVNSLDSAILKTESGIPYLAPEIVLLYKSKNPIERDEDDLKALLPVLTEDQRGWLVSALQTIDPSHAWLSALVS